jgi:Leucine-rich repeat (LRR) protein
MAKPDIVDAFLGATVGSGVVGPIIDVVTEGLKFVYHCREQCSALREELEKVKPLLETISRQCQADSAMKKWLDAFQDCVEKAGEILNKCKSDSSMIWDRAYEVKYGGKILQLKEQINSNINLASMALLAHQSASMGTGSCGIMQQVPGKILGMDHHFKRIKSAVIEGHRRKDSSCCVGIRGMGGAGKTLLAQMVTNDEEIHKEFGKESIIWITVGRDAEISVIYERMRKCLGLGSHFGSLEVQRTHLVYEFSRRSVLLIFDDIWDGIVHEFKEMVTWDWLNIPGGAGSVTVVTTRDEAMTRKCVNAGEEIISLLSEEDSWELFRTHAFGTEIVPLNRDLEVLAKDACQACKCLPLALIVLGRAMKGKRDIREWRRTLSRLHGSPMANKGIKEELFECLRISYDLLDGHTKTCFLYFAAFPEDCEIPVELLCQIWVVEGLFGEEFDKEEALDEAHCALNELLGRSLIERGCDDEMGGIGEWIKMHDILRDLAIHISGEGNESERENLFKMERGLGQFPSSWLGSSLKVRRLSLWGNKMKRFPHNFIAPNLRICMLYPEPWKIFKEDSGGSSQDCTVDEEFFTDMQALRYFQMCGNVILQLLPESIGGLGSLQHLDISWCRALQQLPRSIGRLGSLQYLDISRCGALQQLPESIGELGSLQHLNLKKCVALQQLPGSIGGLGSLQHLDVSFCWNLEQLPESIGGLGSLQHLNLSNLALKELPESIGGLGSLQYLNVSCCEELEQLPKSIGGLGSLQYLNVSYCMALKLSESIEGLGSLEHLDVSYCESLQQFPKSIKGLGSLQHLNVSCCEELEQLPESIGGLGSLQHLNVSCCKELQRLPESIGGLESLRHVDVSSCWKLEQLPESIGRLWSLQHLNVSESALQQLPESIGGLGSLQHLDISGCWASQQLPESIGGLGFLQHLDISWCHALEQLPESIGGLGCLQHLDLSDCSTLQQLPESIGGLGSLQHLNVSNCKALQQLPESIGGLGSLQHLDISFCEALVQLPESIGGLGSLQHLNLRRCIALQHLPESIGGLRSLEYLNLSDCKALEQLPEFRTTSGL